MTSPAKSPPDELSEDIQDALEEICEQGNEAMDEGNPAEAAVFFQQALAILPKPAKEWEAYGWLQAALGDARFAMGDFERSLSHLRTAYAFAGPEEVNPFVLLRLGQCHRRLGDEKNAAEYMLRAYMLEGEDIFEEDAEDFAFLKEAVPL